ncbi:MAG: GNAT family N-acetyltransferase [Proteobacteria bacterium]|nr:GNAT family N-acetyltransferase [Pseudomonadota bacterium]
MPFHGFRGGPDRGLRLQRDRVYLRYPVQSDWRAWSALRADSQAFLASWEPTWARDALSRGAFRRRLKTYWAEMRQGVTHSFLIFRAADDVLLGGVTLSNLRRGVAQTATLGYWIGAVHARQGYVTEALWAVLEYAFQRLGLHRVEAACLLGNEASRRLLLKSGFQEEGYAREYLRINGSWQDHQLFAILRSEFSARRTD